MTFTFLFPQEENTFSGERRRVFEVGGIYKPVKTGEGLLLDESGEALETRERLQYLQSQVEIDKKNNEQVKDWNETIEFRKNYGVVQVTGLLLVEQHEKQFSTASDDNKFTEAHRQELQELIIEKTNNLHLSPEQEKKVQEYKKWYEENDIHQKIMNRFGDTPFIEVNIEAFEKFLAGEEVPNMQETKEEYLEVATEKLSQLTGKPEREIQKMIESGNIMEAFPPEYQEVFESLEGKEITMENVSELAMIDLPKKAKVMLEKSTHLTDNINASEEIKEVVKRKKDQLFQHPDKEGAQIAAIAANPDAFAALSLEEQQEVRQNIRNILKTDHKQFSELELTETLKQFSELELKETLKKWDERGNRFSDKGQLVARKNHYLKLFKNPKNEQILGQVALYETALEAKKSLEHSGQWKEDDLKDSVGMILENVGLGDDIDFTRAYTVANNLMDKDNPQNLLIAYGLKYAGILTVIFNLIAFVQSGGNNTQALAYAAGGAGAVYGGMQVVKKNALHTLFHPEDKVPYTMGPLASSEDRFMLDEFINNMDFYNQINFNKDNRKIFNEFRRGKRKEEKEILTEHEKKMEKEVSSSYDAPDWSGRVSYKDFEGDLSGILRTNPDKETLKRYLPDANPTQQMRRYRTMEWIFNENFTNADFNNFTAYAKLFKQHNPGDLTTTEKTTGMMNKYNINSERTRKRNQKMVSIIDAGIEK